MLLVAGFPGLTFLQLAWFDLCQILAPRPTTTSQRAVIVSVDGASVSQYGQWPWPRTLLADLITRLAEAGSSAIALDILIAEPDRLSPERLPRLVSGIDAELAGRLAELPSNDAQLARAVQGQPVVLSVAALNDPNEPQQAHVRALTRAYGGDPAPFLRRFNAALRSVDVVDKVAAGRGIVNVETRGGAVRRIPLVVAVGDYPVPALSLEMLRVATRAREVRLVVTPQGVTKAGVGDHMVSTQSDASVWLRYSDARGDRFISAADVLMKRVAPERIAGRMVLIGVTALGLADRHPIPGGRAMDGVEIHAELLDSLMDDALLTRPVWATWAEAAFLFVGGSLLVFVVPVKRGRAAPLVLIPLLAVAVAGGLGLFHWGFLLLDAATPSLGLTLVFTVMLAVTLGEAERQRRALRRQIEQQREAAARMEGELSAARRIQMGILPKPADVLAGESRFDLEIVLEPAREVGGDLYDIFRLDDRRLFFLLGDVSGKGLRGSMFMAVSKSLYKSTALRRGKAIAAMMREADAEISRDNPEALFVTAFAGVLDLEDGLLEYCNAGHDPPYLVPADGGPPARLTEAGGPPLCVVDGFEYEAARRRLAPGDVLCLVTDGVTEATNVEGKFYGRARLEALLATAPAAIGAKALAGAIRQDVERFVAGAEPADDLAIMILRWTGPGT